MQRFKFSDFMVIEVRFFKKKMENMAKIWKDFEILYMSYITDQPILCTTYFSHILHLDIIESEINFKLKVKINKIRIYGDKP